MKSIYIVLITTILLLPRCERIDLGEPFEYRTGVRYYIDNNHSFIIDSLNDYRCPVDVICVWSGDVSLCFKLKHGQAETDTVILLMTGNNNPFRFREYSIEIREVNPQRESHQRVDPDDYRITMVVSKE